MFDAKDYTYKELIKKLQAKCEIASEAVRNIDRAVRNTIDDLGESPEVKLKKIRESLLELEGFLNAK